MVLLGALSSPRRRRETPLVACLTAFQTHLTFQAPDDLFALLALPIQGAHLFGAEAEPVGRIVCAAVSHAKYLDISSQRAGRLPVGLLQIAHEGTSLEAPILLELADTIPAIIAEPLAEGLRGIPGVDQNKLRLTAQPVPGIAQELSGKGKCGGSAFVPEPKRQGNTHLSVRPNEQDDRAPEHDFALLTGPNPGRFAQQPGIGLFDNRVIEDQIPTRDREQQA